jgi:hypothetical protein
MTSGLAPKDRLGPAIERAHACVALVPRNELLKLGTRNELDELGKYGRLGHGLNPPGMKNVVEERFLP